MDSSPKISRIQVSGVEHHPGIKQVKPRFVSIAVERASILLRTSGTLRQGFSFPLSVGFNPIYFRQYLGAPNSKFCWDDLQSQTVNTSIFSIQLRELQKFRSQRADSVFGADRATVQQ